MAASAIPSLLNSKKIHRFFNGKSSVRVFRKTRLGCYKSVKTEALQGAQSASSLRGTGNIKCINALHRTGTDHTRAGMGGE